MWTICQGPTLFTKWLEKNKVAYSVNDSSPDSARMCREDEAEEQDCSDTSERVKPFVFTLGVDNL